MNIKLDKKRLKALPSLVVGDEKGNLFDIPEYGMLGRSGNRFIPPEKETLINLPYGSDLHHLPNRYPVGVNRKTGNIVVLKNYRGIDVYAASAFLAPAHTALYLAAFEKNIPAVPLPLFAYTALGFKGDGFVVTALRVDEDSRQDCENFNQEGIIRRGKSLLENFKGNRLATHLIENCAFDYLCPAARNWVNGRFEAPIPVSMGCNSECEGCISKQPDASDVPSTQDRLTFIPTVEEIVGYTVPHLDNALRGIVSFGQGCEGEPLTQAALIEEAIREMRNRTKRGTINLNTNASMPAAVGKLCRAGLDSIRISMNSCREPLYYSYFKPKGYAFSDVLESMRIAKEEGVFVSLNYFIYPGLTDGEEEIATLTKLLEEIPVDMIQMRNLNMDPDLYTELLGRESFESEASGIRAWMKRVKSVRPALKFGYFNPPLR